jgi:hypothetical protein
MLRKSGLQIASGKCKIAGCAITADDAKKMSAIADAFLTDIFEPYILSLKTWPAQSRSGDPPVCSNTNSESRGASEDDLGCRDSLN